MAIHVVLHEPEIPANTGNIARTCAATNSHLHLIHPLGFSTDDKMLKRAGCDYWPNVNITYHDNLEGFLTYASQGNIYFVETVDSKPYHMLDYSDPEKDYFFVFGKETKGLPTEVLKENDGSCLHLPQTDKVRSLNLSNAAAIVVYEACRQQGYAGLK
ncbi:tRNA (uridine(34)/cytosine(34)/5-carboxymethylaminomethyluridine(34)-2'-O)-methyltransferase TrmL [Salsuginibacillus kocurii]|uniref:tRNA (uridine(34)/cytosine(34)/5- carboxymethylaminomethyluridine(34)-2'-O)- methyltransferase TrmL n=1 Tax=Salsuginibacillus kocurii TaxID=427078 RepID=UPI0003721044|nr:tRNA (uridine(34)/cytosine(34)/5-carboxymethylaminomethyluridine(34)-2'-O)-methyltransferase TrmL [Salsuginibacillus kocurii]